MAALAVQPDAATLADVCRRHHVARVRLFGSAARAELRPDSDVDLLIDFAPGHSPSLFDLADLANDLSPLFENRRVDLVRPDGLHWYVRDAVLASAVPIYEG